MNFKDLKTVYNEFNIQIKNLLNERDKFKDCNDLTFKTLFKEKVRQDRQWFIENIDYIWKHKDRLKEHQPFSEIVIDFLDVYKKGMLIGGVGSNFKISMIYLKDLISLWEKGFMYDGKPIIEVSDVTHNGKIISLTYIDDSKAINIENAEKFDETLIKDLVLNSKRCSFDNWDDYKTIDILKGLD